jgi:hypothetical protein
MVDNDVVVFVDVGTPTDPDGIVSVSFWSYGHRAVSFAYKKDGPPLDRFMITCASTYITAELGWWKMKLVSGPNLVGPSEYMLVFRYVDYDEPSGEEVAVDQKSSS